MWAVLVTEVSHMPQVNVLRMWAVLVSLRSGMNMAAYDSVCVCVCARARAYVCMYVSIYLSIYLSMYLSIYLSGRAATTRSPRAR